MTQAQVSPWELVTQQEAELVLSGLRATPKRVPCKLLYDERGSQLFEQICEQPEYYPTRTELWILRRFAAEMVAGVGEGAALVEWGSGASIKTRLILDALPLPRSYVPIDISREILMSSAKALRAEYPQLRVRPVVADYLHSVRLPLSEQEQRSPIVAFFPGSTLGNFEPEEAVEFLARVRRTCGRTQRLLLGTDLPKAKALLEAAYDDRAGVTARFNANILRVLNRRYGANFDEHGFVHRAPYNAAEGRVEMHLVSRAAQTVEVCGQQIEFTAGEPLVTEHCYKYSQLQMFELAERAGFHVQRVWTDDEKLFAVQLLTPSG